MDNRDPAIRAFERGKMAADRCDPPSANPHRPSDELYDAWNAGFAEYGGFDTYRVRRGPGTQQPYGT